MRIIDRKRFLACPPSTIYMKGVPFAFEGLCVKGDSLANDWIYLPLDTWQNKGDDYADIGFHAIESGESIPMNSDGWQRDGCFDEREMFVIYEEADLRALISHAEAAFVKEIVLKEIGDD